MVEKIGPRFSEVVKERVFVTPEVVCDVERGVESFSLLGPHSASCFVFEFDVALELGVQLVQV